MCLGGPDIPPPRPSPPPAPPAMPRVGAIQQPTQNQRRRTNRQGGNRALVINRTTPRTGAQGAGARTI